MRPRSLAHIPHDPTTLLCLHKYPQSPTLPIFPANSSPDPTHAPFLNYKQIARRSCPHMRIMRESKDRTGPPRKASFFIYKKLPFPGGRFPMGTPGGLFRPSRSPRASPRQKILEPIRRIGKALKGWRGSIKGWGVFKEGGDFRCPLFVEN